MSVAGLKKRRGKSKDGQETERRGSRWNRSSPDLSGFQELQEEPMTRHTVIGMGRAPPGMSELADFCRRTIWPARG